MDGTVRLLDLKTGELIRIHAAVTYPRKGDDKAEGVAVWEPKRNKVLEARREIWRSLAWIKNDPQKGFQRFPLEAFLAPDTK